MKEIEYEKAPLENGALLHRFWQDIRSLWAFPCRMPSVCSAESPRPCTKAISAAGSDQGVSVAKRMRDGSCLRRISPQRAPISGDRVSQSAESEVSSHTGAPHSLSATSLSQSTPPAWATTSFNAGWRSMTRRTMSGVQCI